MDINNELLEKVRNAKEHQQLPIVKDNDNISLEAWFEYIKKAPRTADSKELEEYQEKLKRKGLI